MMENSNNLKGELLVNILENSNNLESKMIGLEEKIMENSSHLETKIMESSRNLEKKFDSKLLETRQELDKKIEEIEKRFASLSSGTETLPVAANNMGQCEVISNSECLDMSHEEKKPIVCNRQGDGMSKTRIKPPQFDGKTPWANYLWQFEAAAKANGWTTVEKATALTVALRGDATDILQTLAPGEREDYEHLVKHLEMRYGQTNLEHVYHSQLKNRCQKSSESLKEFQVDIARLVRLAYPATPEGVMERLAVQAFLDGLRNGETRQALILARPPTLMDALARALEFEAAQQSARGQARVRQIEEGTKEEGMDGVVRRVLKEVWAENKKKIECRNCHKMGHIRSRCPQKKTAATSEAVKGQSSVGHQYAPRKIAQVASLEHQSNSVFIDGLINSKIRSILLDTGATKTIIRPSMLEASTKIRPTQWRLRTATGHPATIHGETEVTFTIGNYSFNHRVLVADIEDEVILGMDIMTAKGFQLDFEHGILKINEEEVVLHGRAEERVRVVLAEDASIAERCEVIIDGCIDGRFDDGRIMMLEPGTHDSEIGQGVVIGKSLLHVAKMVPVRVMNVNYHSVVLKKGTALGYCCPVTSIVRKMSAAEESPARKISAELETLVKTSSKGLKTDQKIRLRSLVGEFRDVFDDGTSPRGRTNMVLHKIDTGEARPIRQGARRLPLAKREEADKIVSDMEKEGVIEPSSGPWASPVVLVKKKDGSTRFCVDYRQLNNITKKDSYPLPRIDDTLDTLAGSRIFSTLDLKSGYWQVEMAPEDREKTAFSVSTGLWQFTVMPFGLCNAPATFERLMETVLKGLSWKTCLVYLDDIIVVGKTFEDHIKNLHEVFQRLRQSGLKLSPKKCHLFQQKVQYLGHIVSGDGVAVDPQKIKAVKEWPVPRDKHELRSFLGLCTYYRRFVPGFSNIAKPLTRLTEGERRYQWDEESSQAFQRLKDALTRAPILSYPFPEGNFILDTDASNVGLGGVLSQVQNGQEKVIGYFSKTLSKPERNYCVTRRELLAVVKSMEHFYKYLYGRKFLLRTDHAALKWLLRFKNPEGQVARWIERLQEFDFDTEHRPGTAHGNADALSRRPCPEDCKHCNRAEEKDATVCRTTVIDDNWQPREIEKDQESDPELSIVLGWKKSGQRPTWEEVARHSPAVKSYWAQWNSLQLDDGCLKRVLETAEGKEDRKQIVVPKIRVPEVLKEIHNGTSGGHLGVTRTRAKLRERFYWVNATKDVKEWCKKCAECAASNGPQKRKKAPMRQYNVGSPFERIAIDVAGPFPESANGNKYIVVVMDYFSKWCEAYALPNQEASTVAEALVKDWICRFGVPLELHSDQGRNFESSLFQNVCRILNIHKTRTTALHPQSDGMVERMNRTINRHLSKVVSDHQRDWDSYLHLFLMAYRSSIHETTGQTPASIVMGRELRLPCDLKFGCPPGDDIAGEDYVTTLRRKMDAAHERVRANIQDASDRMKGAYDVRAEDGGYQAGDLVWLYNPQRRRGLSPKLQTSWEGPYEILARINDVVYRIKKSSGGKPRVVHFNRLTPYAGDNNDATVRAMIPPSEMSYAQFMAEYSTSHKVRNGVTKEEQRDLFQVPSEFALAHCVAKDLKMSRGIAATFKRLFGRVDELQEQNPEVGEVVQLDEEKTGRNVFYLVTKELSYQKPTYEDVWNSLISLRSELLCRNITKLAIPKLACGLDGLNWRVIRSMLEVLFRFTGIQILVCSFSPTRPTTNKTVDCYFYQRSFCKKGTLCRYRHEIAVPASTHSGTEMPLRRGQCNENRTALATADANDAANEPNQSREYESEREKFPAASRSF